MFMYCNQLLSHEFICSVNILGLVLWSYTTDAGILMLGDCITVYH